MSRITFMRTLPCAVLLALAACQPAQDKNTSVPASVAAQAMEGVRKGLGEASGELQKAKGEIEAARGKLATENLKLNRNGGRDLPRAEISPAGELLIEGQPVATTPEQKAQVLAYRAALIEVIGGSMAVGMEGARAGIDAAASALQGLASGKGGEAIGAQAKASAEARIRPLVQQLCGRMPALLEAQQVLAASLPEFRPYASLDQDDVDDCDSDGRWDF